jgi:hypothetical protein
MRLPAKPQGDPITSLREVFEAACRRAEIAGFALAASEAHGNQYLAVAGARLFPYNGGYRGHESVFTRCNPGGQNEMTTLIREKAVMIFPSIFIKAFSANQRKG